MALAFLGNDPSKPWPSGQGFKSFLDQELQGDEAFTKPCALAPFESQDGLPIRFGSRLQWACRLRSQLAAGKKRDRLSMRGCSSRH